MVDPEVRVKGTGYLISSISVFLLAVPALKSALERPLLLFCLIAGAILSIVGMFLRYLSHRREKRRQGRI
jgi:uncharacterized protein involved in exopolysaccharide biosynthesis